MDSRRNPNHPAPTKFLSDRLWNANLRTLDADLRYAELPCLYWAKEPAFYSTIKNRHHSENLGHAEDSIHLEPQQRQEHVHSTPSRNPICHLERDPCGGIENERGILVVDLQKGTGFLFNAYDV